MNQTILLVEDNPDILKINQGTLADAGYRVLTAETLEAARLVLESSTPDLLVLDVMLPDGDGVDFCTEIRARGLAAPVLFLTAKGKKEDTLAGLRAGGDDYLTKPYDLDIFLARVQALLRRAAPPHAAQLTRIGEVEIDYTARRALRNGADLLLTPKEFALLEQLVKRQGAYVPAAELYESVWGMDALGAVKTVREHISRLRQKLGEGVLIESVRGKGYRVLEAKVVKS